MNRIAALLLTGIMLVSLCAAAAAEDWMFDRGITIVCPWGLGGGADSTIRPMSELLEEYLGVPVEVRNETGGSGVAGAAYAYAQPADGYTFLLGTQSLYIQDLLGKMDFDFKDAFECEDILLHSINMLAGSKVGMEARGIQTFSDLQSYVAGHPGEVSVALQSATGVDGMCFEIATAGLALNPIPYNSCDDANRDLAEGSVDLAVGGYDDMYRSIESGDVMPLLLFCEHRIAILPDCECTAELNIDSYAGPWRAIFAKKGTPQGAIDAIIEAVEACRGDATWQEFLKEAAYDQRDVPFPGEGTQAFCLRELDAAMVRIQDENVYYNQQLQQKYMNYSGANVFISENELKWLSGHGTVRVGYLDSFLAFCARDKSSGALTGALKDFLALASHCMQNTEIEFEAMPFDTTAEALEALRIGAVDCVFPVDLSISDAEDLGVLITSPQMQSEVCAVVRSAALGDFSLEKAVRVAVSEDNPNTDGFLKDHFPEWQRVNYKDAGACLKAVAEGKADCFLISYYRVNSIAGLLDEYKLSTVTTGAAVNFAFAINRREGELYAILNKVTNLVPSTAVNAALASYSFGEQKLTLERFIRENILSVLALVGVIVAIILVLLLRSQRSEKKTREAMNRIAVLNSELSDNHQKLKEALAASEQASRAKTSFLSNMSHEIRTPMNAIIGLDNIALRDQNLTPHTREQLEKIGSSAKHLLGIINDILDMSRIESGRMALRDEEFSFRDFLDQINVMINGQCMDKGLHFECNIIGHTEDYYIGDDMKLKQVMINILGNAVKFTPSPGTVTFNVEQIQRFEQHCVLRFVMKDTGIGMSKEFIPKIFEAFSQENDVSVSRYGSTGLGMAITKSIVSMMNGEIVVDSEKGVGTTFTVTVTLKVSNRSVRERGEPLPTGMRMLIVDDDPVAQEYEQLVAESVGINADTVESGPEALKVIQAKWAEGLPYQFVLTDYRMPGMDGVAFTRALRQVDDGKTAVILLTGYDWEDKQEEALKAGVDSISSKPLFRDSLLRSVQNILRQREPVEAEAAQAQTEDEDRAGSLRGRRVLVVEDIDLNADILMDLLEMEEVESERAENGQVAVDMFSDHPAGYYDAILMDVRMPVMNGLDAARAIRALQRPDAKEIPIIAMTANAFDEDVQLSLQSGMNAHLSKPVEPERLYETLEQMIHR